MKTLALFCAAAGVLPAAAPLTLVRNGQSSYSICISRSASPSERRAAAELQLYLEKMSGARLPVIDDSGRLPRDLVLVGNSRAVERLRVAIPTEPEAFLLKTAPHRLIIAGGRQRGTMYGVYTFLDGLGCRWFTRDVTRVPNMKNITVDAVDRTERPAFEYREPFVTEAFDKEWAAHNRTNGAHQELDESTGGRLEYYPFVHSFYQMLPPEKHFREHPEYFSLIDGQRRTERGQLCLTNPDVLRLSVAAVREWIRQHPEASIYSVSQNDWEGWCECDNCRRVEQEEGGRHSGPILRFVNALAAEIEKDHPDKLIDTLAYWYSEDPPLKVRPRRNVRIRLCPIGVCEAHPYRECPRSAYFERNLAAWSKITNQLYIWHYNTNFSHYLMPFPDFRELAADLPLYKERGVVGVFLEGGYPKGGGTENAELRAYVMARLLWNPGIHADHEVNDFLDAVYGRAARPMRAYFDLLHAQNSHIWIFAMPEFSPDFLPQAKELFRQADAAAETEEVRRRVRKARLPLDYLELLRAEQFSVRDTEYAASDLPALKDRFASFLAAVRSFGIASLHEGRDLASDEREFARIARAYRVTTIQNAAWRVDAVAELGGRIIRMIDRSAGRDLLRPTDASERGYPSVGGAVAAAHADYQARACEPAWQVASASGGEMSLEGSCGNGMKLRRVVRLTDTAVRIEDALENTSAGPMEAALEARAELDPGDIDQAVLRFRSRGGGAVERKLIRPAEPPASQEAFRESGVPDGAWQLVSIAGRSVTNTFTNALVARAYCSWTAKGIPRATLGLWSAHRKLAPGESLRLASEITSSR